MTAKKMMSNGCIAFLANVIDTRIPKVIINDIPTVREFPDIFPEDLLGLPPDREEDGALIAELTLNPMFLDRIKELQSQDEKCLLRMTQVEKNETKDFEVRDDVCLYYRGRLCILDNDDLKKDNIYEEHYSPLMMHPRDNKLYQDLKSRYWWPSIERAVSEFVARCLTCQQVKAEHQVPSRLLQSISIPEWK
ncbi:uncharacterized protein LOC120168853 [Hibiscus syriacus]|uniref:uncharacterized protein LOC120168853 n=1 Tax=Hibiscus syriacus TaxID=106335 RepID=UPI001923FD32|nr:uncharacterized protein LOC120168853 [Hibiscus syriacus]